MTRTRFICSYGGKIQLIGRANKLTYVGGINKLLYVDCRISFKDMVAEVSGLFNIAAGGDVFLKYQLPGRDGLNSLVSLNNDNDLCRMMLKFDRLYSLDPRVSRIRLFVFQIPNKPLNSVKPNSDQLSPNLGKDNGFNSFRADLEGWDSSSWS
ncbi:hypothetical protein PIB30_077090 [Stylosanthes scabra]|uniref:PB1 domain-containing protein n=1 Tax=Stylosanthes scabra TaxID=79078 RepID=A0ABU6UP78_9FABA|nr:hypothetical protein [Stylosanthes scabra]